MTKLISRYTPLAFWLGVFALARVQAWGQCPDILDGSGQVTSDPTYLECISDNGSGTFEFWPLTNGTWTNLTVDWGDGTAPEFFAEWSNTQAINHTYAYEQEQSYTITFTTADCSAEATLNKSVKVNAGMTPMGQLYGCAPATLEFMNASDNVTSDTEFTWYWAGTSVSAGPEDQGSVHGLLFDAFVTGCSREVRLEATNACQQALLGQADEIIYPGINIWDRDNPAIDASATVLCLPDHTVDVWNISEMVCLGNGNTQQRKEKWTFGGPYGPGGISEIDWRPWDGNSDPITLTFPEGVAGEYTITLAIENYCGIDETSITIVVREPLVAELSGPTQSCEGQTINLSATAPDADWYEWDFYGDGQIWYPSVTGNMVWSYNTPGDYEIQVQVGLDNQSESCTAVARHPLVVSPKPRVGISLSDTEGCDALVVDAEETYLEGVDYEWTLPDGSNALGSQVSGVLLNDVGTHVFGLTVTSSKGCTRSSNKTVEIFPSPTADFTAGAVCLGTETTFTDLSLPGGTDAVESWDWDFGDAQSSDQQHPNHTYTAPGSYTVQLEIQDAHCSAEANLEVEVHAAPDLAVSGTAEAGCSPFEVEFSAESNGDVVWEFGDGNGASGEEATHIFTGDPAVEEWFDVIATSVNSYGCVSEASMTIRTLPSSDASFTVSPAGCSPHAPEFSNLSQRATGYEWTFLDGTVSNDSEPTHVFVNTTGFLVNEPVQLIAFAANGCHDTVGATLNVFPEAMFNLSLDQTEACSPFALMAPPVLGSEDHAWDFGDGTPQSNVPNPVHVYENNTEAPVTFTLTLEANNSYGCPGSVSRDVVVNPSPVAEFTADVQSGCAPLTVSFDELSQRAVSFSWDYGDATSAEGLNGTTHEHTFELGGFDMAARAVTLTVEAEGGCSDSHTLAVEVYPEVLAEPVGELEGCAPWQSNLVAQGYEGATDHTISWTMPDGETFAGAVLQRTFPDVEGVDQTLNFDLNITSPYGCTSSASVEATVHHLPVASFELSEAAACSGTEIQFTDGSRYADAVTLDWGEGEGPTTDPGVSHVFANEDFEPQVVEVIQTATTDFGCVSQAFVNHTVFPKVTAAFLPPAPACAPFTLTLVNQSANATGGFVWDFGDGSPTSQSAQPSHLYETPADANSIYTITLHATSDYGCEDDVSHDVEVHATPIADMELVDQQGCYPLEVTFANNSIGGDLFQWTYGTGLNSTETATEHTVEYYNPTPNVVTYTAVLTVSTDAGCSSQDVTFVEVLPEVEARIEGGMTGCSPLEVNFLNLSDGAVTYEWNFGDGDQSATTHANHTFTTDPGEDATYTVSMIARSVFGCTDTAEVSVHVFAQPVADFVTSSTQLTFPETDITFSNTSVHGENTDFFWTFGDGQVSYNEHPETHVYDTWGTYDITLEVDNGYCSSVASTAVQIVAPSPTIGFSGGGTGCAPLTVQFENESTYASSYRWVFSDGSERSDDSPVHVFTEPGVYDVTLYVEGYEGTELVEAHSAVVEVYPTAEAAFTLNPNHVMVPGQPVFFLNLSEGATEYAWDFGDGASSIAETPIHEYREAGVYDVTLTANNAWGCSTTYTLPEAVLAEAGGLMVFPTAFTPSSTGSNGGYYDPTGYDNDVFRPMHVGVESYELMVFTKWGEMIFFSNDVNVGWDGYIEGKLASTDVYAWKASAVLSNGETLHQVGNVTLLAR